ncbi:hypothetical protein FIBSPDRAFT_580167 [Athelia psychrophila]|uniref:Uncharacterized protein n=1 Tax=Athelia psychrophila TaxID=1759441 RepID=A0A166UKK7_9AGAM|nr:hypothetical protein FIBSPDRAFT_580167 [Fibularhizoctonia sp. CBS 109695]
MPGANYMGGKRSVFWIRLISQLMPLRIRNAAMARSRDATGRVQKGYFGRQRMEALTRGLQAEQNDSPNGGLHLRSCSIDLAHAQHDAPLDDTSYPSPTTPQSNPIENRLPSSSGSKTHGSSSSRSSIRSSKVLLAMDTTEPIFMRAERNRLLAIPDFAGLSKREHIRPNTPPPPKNRSTTMQATPGRSTPWPRMAISPAPLITRHNCILLSPLPRRPSLLPRPR